MVIALIPNGSHVRRYEDYTLSHVAEGLPPAGMAGLEKSLENIPSVPSAPRPLCPLVPVPAARGGCSSNQTQNELFTVFN